MIRQMINRLCLIAVLVVGSITTCVAQNEETLNGDYTFNDGSNITILNVELGLAFFDFKTGRFGVLHKDTAKVSTYFAGPGAMGKDPKEIEIEFHPNFKALTYRDLSHHITKVAKKNAPFRKEGTIIAYDQVGLKSTISYPNTKPPWPAITLIHGGGPGPRAALTLWANMYNRLGYVSLVFDKREKGPGESTGPAWVTFEDLTTDALAAVRYLRAKKRINASRIGLAAFSQGGWVATIAASREPRISFLILISCPMISPAERDSLSSIMRLRTDGFSDTDIRAAEEFTNTYNRVGKGLISMAEYESRLKEAKDKKWFSYVEHAASTEVLKSSFYRSPYGRYYEPSEDLRKIAIPVLAMYGQNDTTVPPNENAKKAYEYLRDNRHSFVFLLPAANHSLIESKTGSDRELINLNTYSKQYFELISIWLRTLN